MAPARHCDMLALIGFQPRDRGELLNELLVGNAFTGSGRGSDYLSDLLPDTPVLKIARMNADSDQWGTSKG